MDTIFLNFGNSKTYDSHRLLLNLLGKIKFREVKRPDLTLYQIFKII